ncbi:hypothetical protein IW147_002637 [Coemansia sp. RSA 720]|nr:hypothetical protein IW147_002637 [Coemansia sp. RSA 720]
MRPLTEKTLDQYVQLLAKQDNGAAENDANGFVSSSAPTSLRPQISYGKLEHIFRYIDDQLNSTQDSLPMSPGVSGDLLEGNSGTSLPLRKQPESETSVRPLRQLRKGKRNLRKPLQPPARTEQTREPVAFEEGAQGCLGAIHVLPVRSERQRPRHLGIFNKGKAVASSCPGPAFSEAEFLRGANICRVRLDDSAGCSTRQTSRVNSQHSTEESARGAIDGDYLWPQNKYGHRVNEHATRRNSYNSGYSPHEPMNGNGCVAGIAECSCPSCSVASVVPQYRPQSLPKQTRAMSPASPSAVHGNNHMYKHTETDDFIPGRHSGLNALNTAHESLYQTQLLCSIDECLKEDGTECSTLPHSNRDSNRSTDDLNISMLFDEPNTGFDAGFNVHGYPQDTLSVFDSSFFASQDTPMPRCPGDITVSDFGNSRYGLAQRSANAPLWTAHNTESMGSVDTLPEYMARSELPPPYISMALTPQTATDDSLYDIRWINQSRANICLSAHPSSPWSHSFMGFSDSAEAMRNPSMMGSRAFMDSYDPVDFRSFQRHMC